MNKSLCLLLPLLTVAILLGGLVACGGDDDVVIPGSPDIVRNGPNVNQNTTGPVEARTRYEFPRLKGGQSDVIVHRSVLSSDASVTGVNYSLEWDHSLKATRWVCYEVYNTVRATSWNRNRWPNGDPWAYDPNVPQSEQQATYNELNGSRPPLPNSTYYQKGHIVASADRLCSQEANGQTFYMTNIYPMVPDFNEQIWSAMESRVRTWGNQADTMYVCKGGTIDSEQNILSRTNGGHIAPRYFFMALLSKKGTALKAMAFWIEHKDGTSWGKLKDYAVNIDRLEELTGIDFFCNLSDQVEIAVESVSRQQMLSDWGLN